MVSRRWLGGMAVAGVALWLARAARAAPGADATEAAASVKPAVAPATAASAAPARRAGVPSYAAESARTASPLPRDEREARIFLRAASQSARFESEAARLALAKAQGTAALAWADDLLQYHEAAGVDLLRLMHARGMAPPMLENAQRKALNRLARLSGPRFDREFMELAGPAQQREGLQFLEKAAAIGDPAVRAWVERQLPALRSHLAGAERPGGLSAGNVQRVE